MADFEPFAIADYNAGLLLAREPWLSPENSWREFENAHIRNGRVETRQGYSLRGSLHPRQAEDVGQQGQTAIAGTLATLPLRPGSAVFWDDGFPNPGGQVVTDDGMNELTVPLVDELPQVSSPTGVLGTFDNLPARGLPIVFRDPTSGQEVRVINGVFTGDYSTDPAAINGVTYEPPTGQYVVTFAQPVDENAVRIDYALPIGTIDYTTGAYAFTLPAPADQNVQVNYESSPNLPVMGIFNFTPRQAGEYEIVCDTRRLYVWSQSEERYIDATGQDEFTGGEEDFFDFTPHIDILIINNGVDHPKAFDPFDIGGTGAPILRDLNTNFGPEEIEACKLTVRHRGRVLYFNLVEGQKEYPQRVRLSEIGNPELFLDEFQVSDCPTNARIVSARVIQDEIIVKFDTAETWKYRYKQDPLQPYEWVKISHIRGGASLHGSVELENTVLTISTPALTATDGREVRDMDEQIPDYTLGIDDLSQAFGIYVDEYDEVWWTNKRRGAERTNQVLAFDRKTGAWSVYSYALSCLGTAFQRGEVLWDDVEAPWDDIEATWDESAGQPGFPLVLGGSHDGKVYLMNSGAGRDDGVEFQARMRTQRLNPFKAQSRKAHLGYVDVICDRRTAGQELTLRFLRDFSSAIYLTATIDLAGFANASSDKVRQRIRVNQIADFHTIEMTTNASRLGIDAIIPWFKPAGKARSL